MPNKDACKHLVQISLESPYRPLGGVRHKKQVTSHAHGLRITAGNTL